LHGQRVTTPKDTHSKSTVKKVSRLHVQTEKCNDEDLTNYSADEAQESSSGEEYQHVGPTGRVKCDYCEKQFPFATRAKEHMVNVNPEAIQLAKYKCPKSFHTITKYNRHM